MRAKSILQTLVFTTLISLTACRDEVVNKQYSTQEAAETIGASLAESYAGLTAVLASSADGSTIAVENSGGRVAACGYSDSETITKTNKAGSSVTYNFNFQYSYELTCTLDNPLKVEVDVTYAGQYSGSKLASTQSGTGNFNFSALDKDLTEFKVLGTYKQTGSFESKVGEKTTANSAIDITLADIMINKATKQVTSGSASITLTGTALGKEPFSMTATVTFLGNKAGSIVLNGETYNVNLLTGEVTN